MKTILKSIIVSFALLGFFPSFANGAACEDVGAACRAGWISGCGSREEPIYTHSCPAHPSGDLICCQISQGINECTSAGGLCRSDSYAIFWPEEPACGYNGDVQSSDSCGGAPSQICCLPPPNIGASCGAAGGTCQLSNNCVGGGIRNGACFGGAVCCSPTLDSFSVPGNCTILTGQFSCSISASWSISNSVSPLLEVNGNFVSNAAASAGTTVFLDFGLNILELSDGPTDLGTRPSSASCETGSSWDGSKCKPIGAPVASSFIVPMSCTIPIGGSHCDISVSWSITNPGTPSMAQDSTVFSIAASSPGVLRAVSTSFSVFELSDGGTVLKTGVSSGVCITGSSWDVATGTCAASSAVGCTGATTGLIGTCVVGGMCSTTADTSGICAAGEVCCVPNPPPPPADTCTGGTSSNPGLCKGTCIAATENTEFDLTCGPVMNCCTPKTPPPPGPVISGTTLNFPNPLKFDDLPTFVSSILTALQKLIATLAIIFIIIGAFLYITSAGDSGRVEAGKKCILGALIGLALGIAAPMFFKEIATLLGWTPAGLPVTGSPKSLLEMAMGVVNFLLSVIGVIALIMLIIGSFMYLTAAGDESRIDTGKSIVKYSVIGIAVALSALVLVRLVAGFF